MPVFVTILPCHPAYTRCICCCCHPHQTPWQPSSVQGNTLKKVQNSTAWKGWQFIGCVCLLPKNHFYFMMLAVKQLVSIGVYADRSVHLNPIESLRHGPQQGRDRDRVHYADPRDTPEGFHFQEALVVHRIEITSALKKRGNVWVHHHPR